MASGTTLIITSTAVAVGHTPCCICIGISSRATNACASWGAELRAALATSCAGHAMFLAPFVVPLVLFDAIAFALRR